jgi:hypothetical protein
MDCILGFRVGKAVRAARRGLGNIFVFRITREGGVKFGCRRAFGRCPAHGCTIEAGTGCRFPTGRSTNV